MQVVLFIGHHKVGSSSLQQHLAGNWLALSRAGLLYPSVESEGLARDLARVMHGRDAGAETALNVREPHNALAFRMISEATGAPVPPWHPHLPASRQMILALQRQAEQLAPRGMLIVSEVMANFGAAVPEGPARLREAFPGARFRVLATLRRPDVYLASWHNQRLKFGHAPRALRAGALEGYWGGVHFDLRRMLEVWLDAFAGEDVSIADYRKVRAAGGSVPDFRARSGLKWPAGLRDFPDANPSLPRAAMEIVRRANAALSEADAAGLRRFLMKACRRLDLAPDADVELYGAQARGDLARRFEPIHAWLGRRTGRDPFFADIAEVEALRPIPELDAARDALEKLRALPALRRSRLPLRMPAGPPEAAADFLRTLRLE
jgi:hypothetical protein